MTSDNPKRLRPVPTRFEERAAAMPRKVAIAFEDLTLTYDELNRLSAHLAAELRDMGVVCGTVVGLCATPCLELVIGALAILRAGGIYLPLDPSYPSERLDYMIADSGCQLILAMSTLEARLPTARPPILHIDGFADRSRRIPGGLSSTLPRDFAELAYIVYTSGSTGRPKGVEGTHRSLANRIEWGLATFPYEPGEISCLKTSISFVDSLSEMFTPLLGGCKLTIVPAGLQRDPVAFVDFLASRSISRLVAVPSLLSLICSVLAEQGRSLGDLKIVVSSGEALSARLAGAVLASMPYARLVNLYGSSEIGGDVTFSVLTHRPDVEHAISIGHPIANTVCIVMDEHGRPVPDGVAGELYVGGDGLARGYRNKPEETATLFVATSLTVDAPCSRFYRTGDLARRQPNGSFIYLGRIDNQVKVGGVRVELGDVEHALASLAGVRDAAVAAHERTGHDRYLAAYVVLDAPPTDTDISRERVRLHEGLCSKLPLTMVPGHIEIVLALPSTPNGKLDRRALRPGIGLVPAVTAVEPDVAATQQTLREIWSEVLDVVPDAIGAEANFYALGGNSFALLKLVFRYSRQWHSPLDVPRFLEEPTLAALARTIERGPQRPEQEYAVVSGAADVPLTPSQQRLLDGIDINHPRIRHHNIEFLLQVDGEAAAVGNALERFLARHDVFRITGIGTGTDGRMTQFFGTATVRPPINRSGLDGSVANFIEQAKACRQMIDPARGRLYEFQFYGDANGASYVYGLINHLIFDGYSHYVLLSELASFLSDPTAMMSTPLHFGQRALAYAGDPTRNQLEPELAYWEAIVANRPDRAMFADAEGGPNRVVTTTRAFRNGFDAMQRCNEVFRSNVVLAACVFAVAQRYGLKQLHARIVGSGRMAVDGIDDSLTVGYVSDHYPQVFDLGLDVRQTLAQIAGARSRLPRGGAGYPWLRHAFRQQVLVEGAQINDFPMHFNYMPRSDRFAAIHDRTDRLGEPDVFLGDEDYAGLAFFVVEEDDHLKIGLYRNSRHVRDETADVILDLVIDGLDTLAASDWAAPSPASL